MSNIYDALSKQKDDRAARRPTPVPPPVPAGEGGAPLPVVTDPDRDRELEALRKRILLELPADHNPLVVFTGAVPGEGASTLALHFARQVAEAEGAPVLLVDGDFGLSAHSLTSALRGGGEEAPGLSDLFAGRSELPEAVLATDLPRLHFLPRGRESSGSPDVIKPEMVQQVLRGLTRQYSFVVIDAGASLEAAEAAILAMATDGVVLVVRANRTRREVVQKAVGVLHRANCRLIGVVLNDRRYPIPSFLYRRV